MPVAGNEAVRGERAVSVVGEVAPHGRGGAARWAGGGNEDTPHEQRRRRLAAAHPAHAVDLRLVTHHQLETLKNQVGVETFERLVQSTDPDTLKQIREYIPL
ncbi:hypothetical protein RR48_13517 [Papilio machaon]|uniref:Importin-7/11-like TPR repeats domain-containing protein n=1 Tax=Papilio machaon TaxID=76193 RepID=A0A194RET8_PAPMA|nr:hypothetical protein RR48_13517 [Papilio machaon]